MDPWHGWGFFFSSRSLARTLLATIAKDDRMRRNPAGMRSRGEAGYQFS